MELSKIDKYEYEQLLNSGIHSTQDMFKLSSYPYVSLVSRYDNLSIYDRKKIRDIEDDNISTFFRIVSLLFGIGPQSDVNTINSCLNKEPLRSAVIAARQEPNPSERMPKYIELACKLLLSIDIKGTSYLHPINVKVKGKIPAWPFSNRQQIADEWFCNLVDVKLNGLKKVYIDLGPEMAYKFFVSSIIHSLYFFAPSRYYISSCRSEDEALHKVFEIFTNLRKEKL